MATLDDILSQETKPAHPSEITTTDLHGIEFYSDHVSGGSAGNKTIDYTINIDTTVLTAVFEKLERQLDQMRAAMERLEAAVAELQDDEDDEEESDTFVAPFSGTWRIDPSSVYVSNGTNTEWKNVGEVTSASMTFNDSPLEMVRAALVPVTA